MKIADTALLVTGANRGLDRALAEEALRMRSTSASIAERWRSGAAKALERQFAAMKLT